MDSGTPTTKPEDVVGRAIMLRLRLAGFEVKRRKSEAPFVPTRFSCPMCGYSALGGPDLDAFADWGEIWHRACAQPGQVSPSRRRPGLSPMVAKTEGDVDAVA